MTTDFEFICEDCSTQVCRVFLDDPESRIPVCMNCQWERRQEIKRWRESDCNAGIVRDASTQEDSVKTQSGASGEASMAQESSTDTVKPCDPADPRPIWEQGRQ